jgi:antitoxin ParD1/3/4
MPTRNVNLTDHYDNFIKRQIKQGRFRNASEIMRAGLRLLEQKTREDREKLALLRSLATEGFDQLDQGQGIAIKSAGELETLIAGIGRRAPKRVHSKRNGN